MKKFLIISSLVCASLTAQASAAEDYLHRFMAYQQWSQNLPLQPDKEFLAFVDGDNSLARKLREKWLYQLAQQKDWASYNKHYKNSTDASLQCYALLADYYMGQTTTALAGAKSLWLTGDSQPGACNPLFEYLLKSADFDEALISQRISLALDKRNFPLARHLLKLYKKPRPGDEKLLITIYQNPARINALQPGELHGDFYLYGLKRLVSSNMKQALKYWQQFKSGKLLNQAQQQTFLAHVALYKAIRNQEDAKTWFARIKPGYYTDVLLDWQIRAALKFHKWAEVERLILHSQGKDNPAWQYWLARSKEARGFSEQARTIYQTLAKTRNYYGFLASLRLKTPLSFQNEKTNLNIALLKPYRPILNDIKSLYQSNQLLQASRLLNDFLSELPKEDKSALIYWLAADLQWYGKSIYLSSSDELTNQLSLRFPLINPDEISRSAKNYHIDQEFIYAIIRQESCFRNDAVSQAGARGLMQILPNTATMVARKEKIPYSNKEQLFSSGKNITIGTAYLQHLAKRFDKHPVLIAAAYNAGPGQVRYWLKNHPPRQIDEWIETLPWHETRNYLKNIIAFYAVYQYRLQHKPDLKAFMQPLS